ncbi:hypothetical protein D9611_008115 [Ephemerocybe angulata]|uniref:Protein kinase domain-containing protein n=1 Tax=Ephemerocybe angulata TaxID=980116 RepID=A0A8H5FD48_9AGAR|nr:hypothetical protein D9611_008115 [Tulosesus angulatus]
MDASGYEPFITSIGTNCLYELPNQETGGSQSRFFLTTRSLRGTRVWEAIEVESREHPRRLTGAKPVVLKDAWIRKARMSEKDMQTQLFDDIRAFAANPNWREHPLLSKFGEHGKDRMGRLLEGDKFRDLFLCASLEHTFVDSRFESPGSQHAGSTSSQESERSSTPEKVRVVTVYEEMCTALDDLSTLGEAINVLKQTVAALQLMMVAGWVHHDISPGNILAFRENESNPWRLKLSDLEYARKCSDDNELIGPPIGTPPFMPCEIRSQRRVLWSHLTDYNLVYDFQHDLESVWWIWLWLITSRILDSAHSREAYRRAFTYSLERGDYPRKEIWGGLRDYKDYLPQNVAGLFSVVEALRVKLLELASTHKDTSNSTEDNYERYSAAHVLFEESFSLLEATDDAWSCLALLKRRKPHGEDQSGSQGNAPHVYSSRDIGNDNRLPSKVSRAESKDRKAQGPITASKKRKAAMKSPVEPPTDKRVTRSMTNRKLDEDSRDVTGSRITRSKTRLGQSKISGGYP